MLLCLRELRREHRWLAANLTADDVFDHRRPCNGSVLLYGLRHSPSRDTSFLLAANLEGRPARVVPAEWMPGAVHEEGWQLAAATPGVSSATPHDALTLHDSEGVLFVRHRRVAA